MKVFLDDERESPYGWIRSESADIAIFLLKHYDVSEISLDHDLGLPETGSGYDVLLWIEEQVFMNGYKPPKIHIHTANSSARIKMENAVKRIEKEWIDKCG